MNRATCLEMEQGKEEPCGTTKKPPSLFTLSVGSFEHLRLRSLRRFRATVCSPPASSFVTADILKIKKPKSNNDYAAVTVSPPGIAVSSAPPPPTNVEKEDVNVMGGGGHVLQNSGALNSNLTPPNNNAFRRDNWVNMHSMPDPRKSATDINISLPDS
ncbi:hypothetical protein RJT34_12117 [Clitoria ternatea]|uniref:Uncharacterized protein n=1 Tax=Clitoria ternatea TaxID=43366 RepID=A0AAN9JN48_CLITE